MPPRRIPAPRTPSPSPPSSPEPARRQPPAPPAVPAEPARQPADPPGVRPPIDANPQLRTPQGVCPRFQIGHHRIVERFAREPRRTVARPGCPEKQCQPVCKMGDFVPKSAGGQEFQQSYQGGQPSKSATEAKAFRHPEDTGRWSLRHLPTAVQQTRESEFSFEERDSPIESPDICLSRVPDGSRHEVDGSRSHACASQHVAGGRQNDA